MTLEEKYSKLTLTIQEIEKVKVNVSSKLTEHLQATQPQKYQQFRARLDSLIADQELLQHQLVLWKYALENKTEEASNQGFWTEQDEKNLTQLRNRPFESLEGDRSATRLMWANLSLSTVPQVLPTFDQLRELSLSRNRFTTIPAEVFALQNLERLDMSFNLLSNLSNTINKLSKLRFLSLSNNKLTLLESGWSRGLSNLEILSLSNNHLTAESFEGELTDAVSLRALSLSQNNLQTIPQSICLCPQLLRLYLNGNQIQEIPPFIENLKRLQWVALDNNQLSVLPLSVSSLPSLIGLGISNNKIVVRPELSAHLRVLRLEGNMFKVNTTSNQSVVPPASSMVTQVSTSD